MVIFEERGVRGITETDRNRDKHRQTEGDKQIDRSREREGCRERGREKEKGESKRFSMETCMLLIHSFVHLFIQAISSPLLLRSAQYIARILCRSFMPKRHRQLRVKDMVDCR